ncbi:Rho termination factor N-terminal domain-containing protein [Flavobacterium sp. N1719]|uniref:Rho termination factor N-terminal domain-containing protein n=1 Tax=Flavobacterium sp. N1719 TaxID=2885633 RepID=UPI0022236865|nr:Rho termination factor N-terminal domain-containing protein [Flavobacterium sp. N1719]
MESIYYISIKSVNLAHYLSSGIIAPSIYIDNRNPDIQDRFKNNILLSTFKYTSETNCAVEIVLNSVEEAPRKISQNFFLFDMPIPISRIKAIYFSDEEQKINTEFNITSGAAFIPKGLLKDLKEDGISIIELENVDSKSTGVDWSHFLKKYDQLMGGFAAMKIAKEAFQNYPTHYFKSLGYINELFNEILIKQKVEVENNFEFAFKDNGKSKAFHDTIYNEITSNVVQNYASSEKVKLETRNGLIQIDKIPYNTYTYLVAILESYGPGKRKQVDSFVSDLISGKFIENKKEGLALIFGLNKGYKSFRNKYKTENFETTIKFKLDSQLDYYIIESIYQNVFNNSSNSVSRFEYIDSWCVKIESEQINTSDFVTYKVLDKIIIQKKKQDIFKELFLSSLGKRNKIYDIIYQKINEWFPNFIKLDEEQLKEYFKVYIDSSIEEFANYIYNETKAEFKEKDAIIENLNRTIKEKDEIINSLNRQVKESKDNQKQVFSTEVNLEAQSKFEDVSEVRKQNESFESTRDDISKNEIEIPILFPDMPEITKQARESELKKFKLDELKRIAKKRNINKYNSFSKPQLIIEILKTEF